MVTCTYCGFTAVLVGGDIIYPHRPDLKEKKFWKCTSCTDVYVGTYPGTDKPMGSMANQYLRSLRRQAHNVFDKKWHKKGKKGRMTRSQAYKWLANKMKIRTAECHIGMFNVNMCKKVIAICKSK